MAGLHTAAAPTVHPVCPTFLRSKPVAAIWTACRPRRRPVKHTGATNSTIQYYNPGNGNIPPAQVQRSDSATYQPRLCSQPPVSALFSSVLSRFYFYTGHLSFHGTQSPSGPSRTCTSSSPPRRSHRRRSLVVPSPFDRVPSRFHLAERLYLIGWIINHR